MQESDHDRDVVGLHVGEDRGHVQGMNEVGLARPPHLPAVLARGKDVCPPQQVLVGLGVVSLDLVEDLLETDHDDTRLAGNPSREA